MAHWQHPRLALGRFGRLNLLPKRPFYSLFRLAFSLLYAATSTIGSARPLWAAGPHGANPGVTAAAYLCRAGGDLSGSGGRRTAVLAAARRGEPRVEVPLPAREKTRPSASSSE